MIVIVTETIPRRNLSFTDGSLASAVAAPLSNISVFTLAVISLERACAVLCGVLYNNSEFVSST